MLDLVVVGSSWGGLVALERLLSGLPRDFGAAVAIVQHRTVENEEGVFASLLSSHTALPVAEAGDKDRIRPGRVYLAPADYHLLVEPGAFALSIDERVQFARPSIDVLFESAADAFGPRVAGVILTGANEDGAAGLARIRARGGATIVQDPEHAERAEMPRAAIAAGGAERVLPLDEIAPALVELCRAGSVA